MKSRVEIGPLTYSLKSGVVMFIFIWLSFPWLVSPKMNLFAKTQACLLSLGVAWLSALALFSFANVLRQLYLRIRRR